MNLDLDECGLRVIFHQDWQVEIVTAIWEKGSITSSEAYELVKNFGWSGSRTAIINFLNSLWDEEIVDRDPITVKNHLQFNYLAHSFKAPWQLNPVNDYPPSIAGFKDYVKFRLNLALMEAHENG